MYLSEHVLKVWANEAVQQKPYPNKLFPPSPYYRFLGILTKELKPRLSVILGVCGGGDCLHMALGHKEGKVVGVDITYDHPQQLSHIQNVCPNFVFYEGDSVSSAKTIVEKFGQPSILFIDTTHTLQQTNLELEAWLPYMTPNHIICFDDLFRPDMDDFWETLEEPKLRLDNLHDGAENGGGFGVKWSIA
jgi:cephalosporin hydroxylase